MGIPGSPAQRLCLVMPRQGKSGRPDAKRFSLPVYMTAGRFAKQRRRRLKDLDRRPHVLELRTLMSSRLRDDARLTHGRHRVTTTRRSGSTGRSTGRTCTGTAEPAVALCRRGRRFAPVIRSSAAGGTHAKHRHG